MSKFWASAVAFFYTLIVCENSENYDEAVLYELKRIQYRVRGADFERVWKGVINDLRKITFYND